MTPERTLLRIFLVLSAAACNAYKISNQQTDRGNNAQSIIEYKGEVFLIKETGDFKQPFAPTIVEGGIELVRVPLEQRNEPLPEQQFFGAAADDGTFSSNVHEDAEYFAVLVTPETVAESQIPRTVGITIPLGMLLYAASSRIPWMLALKKSEHYDYFRLLQVANTVHKTVPRQIGQARIRREVNLVSDQKKYQLMNYDNSEDNKQLQDICATVLNELSYLNSVLRKPSVSAEDRDEQFDFWTNNDSHANRSTAWQNDLPALSNDDREPALTFLDKFPVRDLNSTLLL